METTKGHYIFGTVKVGERGQIIIPKEARQVFDIKAGDTLIVLGDEKWGIAVTKADVLEKHAYDVFKKNLGGTDGCRPVTQLFSFWKTIASVPLVRKQAVPYSNRRRNFTRICASTGMTGAIM